MSNLSSVFGNGSATLDSVDLLAPGAYDHGTVITLPTGDTWADYEYVEFGVLLGWSSTANSARLNTSVFSGEAIQGMVSAAAPGLCIAEYTTQNPAIVVEGTFDSITSTTGSFRASGASNHYSKLKYVKGFKKRYVELDVLGTEEKEIRETYVSGRLGAVNPRRAITANSKQRVYFDLVNGYVNINNSLVPASDGSHIEVTKAGYYSMHARNLVLATAQIYYELSRYRSGTYELFNYAYHGPNTTSGETSFQTDLHAIGTIWCEVGDLLLIQYWSPLNCDAEHWGGNHSTFEIRRIS